jgi:predicted dehydrogenase
MIARNAMLSAIATAEGAELHAVASRDLKRTRAACRASGAAVAHRTYESLLADDDVDAVYIALANDAHAPLAIEALDAGKHVLCEKPLGLTVAEVDDMTDAAKRNERLLVEASWYRWHPRIRLAQRLLHEIEVVGRVRYVTAGFTFAGVAPDNYRLDPAKGGGALYDVGCYAVSAALWAFGTPPREVSAKADVGPTGVDLTASVTVTFDGGEADVRASIAEEPRQWLVVVGDRGELELRVAPFTAWEGQETELRLSSGDTDRVAPANAYRLMVENVSAVAEGRDGWVLPLAESRATAQVLDAAFESAAAQTPVAL